MLDKYFFNFTIFTVYFYLSVVCFRYKVCIKKKVTPKSIQHDVIIQRLQTIFSCFRCLHKTRGCSNPRVFTVVFLLYCSSWILNSIAPSKNNSNDTNNNHKFLFNPICFYWWFVFIFSPESVIRINIHTKTLILISYSHVQAQHLIMRLLKQYVELVFPQNFV